MHCFSDTEGPTGAELTTLLTAAADAAQEEYGEKDAVDWAEGYKFPNSMIESHTKCFQAAGLNFTAMVRRRLAVLSPGRLNRNRAANLRLDNPERRLVMDLAEGMRVHLPVDFAPNGNQIENETPLRSSYVRVESAVNKMLADNLTGRLAFLLPLDQARRLVKGLHLSKAHWTRKKGKRCGRPLSDLTFVDGSSINTPETADAASAFYGEIKHPTIECIAKMIMSFWAATVASNPDAKWEDLRIYKMDLKGAYTLLSFRPEDVALFGMRVTGDLVYFQICGIFGWTGTPAAFQVITRALQFEFQHKVSGQTTMYVDDIIGVCMEHNMLQDMAHIREICTDLLGPGAVADEKTEHGRRLEAIGYVIDLDIRRVLISRKNFMNALYGFSLADKESSLSLKNAQRLASYGSRYGKICRVMRPFSGSLNRLTTGRTCQHALIHVTPEARIAIACWLAMLYLVKHDEIRFTRTLSSFVPQVPTLIAQFDASLSGVGVVWYRKENGTEECVGFCAVSIDHLGFKDNSSYQNLAEFIGAVISVIGALHVGTADQPLELRGDSVTALTWAITERPRGVLVTRAAIVWTLLCLASGVNIHAVTHVPGSENTVCDQLSRRGTCSKDTVEEHALKMGLTGCVVNLSGNKIVEDIILACAPIPGDENTEEEFIKFWCTTKELIDRLMDQR